MDTFVTFPSSRIIPTANGKDNTFRVTLSPPTDKTLPFSTLARNVTNPRSRLFDALCVTARYEAVQTSGIRLLRRSSLQMTRIDNS